MIGKICGKDDELLKVVTNETANSDVLISIIFLITFVGNKYLWHYIWWFTWWFPFPFHGVRNRTLHFIIRAFMICSTVCSIFNDFLSHPFLNLKSFHNNSSGTIEDWRQSRIFYEVLHLYKSTLVPHVLHQIQPKYKNVY